MRYVFLTLVSVILFLTSSLAQFSTKKQSVIGGSEVDELHSMVKTKDGGFIAGGSSMSGISGQKSQDSRGARDYWVVKFDKNNNIQWDKTIGGGSNDDMTAVIQTLDGGYALIGTSDSWASGEKSQDSRGFQDYWVVKLDANGNVQWDKTIGGDLNEWIDYIRQAPDGSYIVAGSSESGISGEKTENSRGFTDYWIVKLDSRGNKIWDKTIGGSWYEWCSPYFITKDGGILVGGFSGSNASGEKSENYRGFFQNNDLWIVKLDKKGRLEWERTIGGNEDEYTHAMLETQSGEIVIGASSRSYQSGEKSDYSRGGFDYWLVKLDKKGNKIWDKTIGGNGEDFAISMEATREGNFVLGGNSYSTISGEKTEGRRGSPWFGDLDYWVVKIDECGKVLWDKTVGGYYHDDLTGLIDKGDDQYILGGTSWSFPSGDKTQFPVWLSDFWIVNLSIGKYGIPTMTSQKTLGGYWDELIKTQGFDLTKDGGWVVGASSASEAGFEKKDFNRGSHDYWVIKYNAAGNIEWEKTIGATDYDELMTIRQTRDEGFILAGNSTSGQSFEKTEPSRGDFDVWVVKLDKTGAIQWDKTIGGSAGDFISSISQTRDGGYILGCFSYSNASGEKSADSKGWFDFWTIKLDKNGNIEWDKTIGGIDGEFENLVFQTDDGGYISAGSSASNASFDKTQNSRGGSDYWIVKLDRFGNVQWDKTFGGSDNENLSGIQPAVEGGYLLAGSSLSNISGEKSADSRGGADYWLVKIDKSGKVQWDKTVGGILDDWCNHALTTRDEGFLLGGVSYSPISGEKTEYNRNDFDYWIVKVNSKGMFEWDKTLGGVTGDLLYTMKEPTKGNYLLGGFSWSYPGEDRVEARGGLDLWLIDFTMRKVRESDCDSEDDRGFDTTIVSKSVPREKNKPGFHVFPVPAKDLLTVRTDQQMTVSLWSQSGRQVLQKYIHGNNVIDVSHLTPGVYYLKNDRDNQVRKVVIVK